MHVAGMHAAWTPYCGEAPLPGELFGRWNLDPLLLLAIAAAAVAYYALQRPDRSASLPFAAAIGVALALFVSPFCALTSALFSARVLHHLLLGIVLAPLIALALPRVKLVGPITAWTLMQLAVFWFWHAPAAYAAALSDDGIYWLMQLSIAATAVLFWIKLRTVSLPGAVASLLLTMVGMGLLGALITFAGQPLYAPHLATTRPWGLSALDDQQLAGLIMWAPGGGFYLAAALLTLSRWLRAQALETAAR